MLHILVVFDSDTEQTKARKGRMLSHYVGLDVDLYLLLVTATTASSARFIWLQST